MSSKQTPNGWHAFSLLTQLGLSFILSVLVSFMIGYGLDHWLGTQFFKILFIFVGLAAGAWSWYKLLRPFLNG
jgi:F0F1-type ATP synthase assembly protein I